MSVNDEILAKCCSRVNKALQGNAQITYSDPQLAGHHTDTET